VKARLSWKRKLALLGVVLAVVTATLAAMLYSVIFTVRFDGVNWVPSSITPVSGKSCRGPGLDALEFPAGGVHPYGSQVVEQLRLTNTAHVTSCAVSAVSVWIGQNWSVDSTNAPLTPGPFQSETLTASFHAPGAPFSGSIAIDYSAVAKP
jgi:hypothetical protein